jgi:trehalose 2-sulfotransferase
MRVNRQSLASHPDSYLICGTPRTGSTLLCKLLDSSGVAGHPESFFRREGMKSYAQEWRIPLTAHDSFNYADYVRAAIISGSTENGIFAVRVMWGTLAEMVDGLGGIYPELAGKDLELLHRALGRTRFVYLRREDVVRQAVSWLRAEQTNVWHKTINSNEQEPAEEPHFDFTQLDELIHEIETHNAAWQAWFAKFDIQPYSITYEQLDGDALAVARGLLDFLGLEIPSGRRLLIENKRLADEISSQWAERYRAELAYSKRR